MYIDAQLRFANGQTLAGDAVSENVLDFGLPRNLGVGEDLYIIVAVDADLTGTLQVNVETDDNDSFSSATVTADIGTFAAAAVAGSQIIYKVSPDVLNERYARLDFNGATAGDVSAFMVKDIQKYTSYAAGYTVS